MRDLQSEKYDYSNIPHSAYSKAKDIRTVGISFRKIAKNLK